MNSNKIQGMESDYKIFLYIFYICLIIIAVITFFWIYTMFQESLTKETYVTGEVLVKTEFPTPHFAKLVTWLYFSSIIGWYCLTRTDKVKIGNLSSWKLTLTQIIISGFAIICLYETIYNFTVLGSEITVGTVNGKLPDIDALTVVYLDPHKPWNLTFSVKIFLAGFLISVHAFYLSTRSKKS